MARISTYVKDTNVVGADKWIGSDSQNHWQTKNFTAADVAHYINRVASESQLLRYVYGTEGAPGTILPNASITFSGGGAASVGFAGITAFVLSQHALNVGDGATDVSGWYTSPYKGSDVLITQCDDLTNWGIFSWTNATVNASDNKYWDISVTYVNGNGSLTEDKDYFISLLTYNTSATNDKYFTAVLNGNASTYTISHDLNKYCSVTVTEKDINDDPTDEIKCSVVYLSLNQIRVDFDTNFNGVIMCN